MTRKNIKERQEEGRQKLRDQQNHMRIISSRPDFLLVGTEKQLIAVPQDLLNLHSAFFRNIPATFVVDNTTSVSKIKPTQFTNFMIWLQTGIVSSETNHKILPNENSITLEAEYEGLWVVGERLQAPEFHNYCMEKILDFGKKKKNWPTSEVAGFAYKNTKKGSGLRLLVADLLDRKNPTKALSANSTEHKNWRKILKEYSELSRDMLCVAGSDELEEDPIWDED